MSHVAHAIEVDVPTSTAYNQWTQFESFPHFMHNVESVTQLDDTTLRWQAKAGPARRQWDAVITEQIPDKTIAWEAKDGTPNSGRVTFTPISDDASRVELEMELGAESWTDKVADRLGVLEEIVSSDLQRFKDYIEDRGPNGETGSWRGHIADAAVTDSSPDLAPHEHPAGLGGQYEPSDIDARGQPATATLVG